MADPAKPDLVVLRDARERTIAILTEHFVRDVLDIEEFDRRVDLAHRAGAPAELEALVADLGPAEVPATALAPRPAPALAAAGVPDRKRVVAILGGVNRRGHWTVGRHTRVVTVLGGVTLDFR